MTVQMIHASFTRGTADVRAASERLAHDRDDVDARVRGFLAAGWSGVAATAFAEAWDDWKRAADDVKQGLDAMADLMAAVQRDFIEQDTASQASLDAVSARIVDRLG